MQNEEEAEEEEVMGYEQVMTRTHTGIKKNEEGWMCRIKKGESQVEELKRGGGVGREKKTMNRCCKNVTI